MKKLLFLIVLLSLFCVIAYAQKRTFLRLYSLAGNKFQKGHFSGTTDSSIFIYKDNLTIEVPAVNIGYIKTKRSTGHHMLAGALIGAIPISILGAIGGEPKENDHTLGGVLHNALTLTPSEGAVTGFVAGSLLGTATGALASALPKSTTFNINGSISEWQLQKQLIDLLPAGK